MVRKILSNAVMQTKVINCNIANKSCFLQLVHTKAIAASTQFCDFFRQEPSHVLAAPLDAAVAFVVHQFAANFVGYLSVI